MLYLIRDLEKLPLDKVRERARIFIKKMNTKKKQDYLDQLESFTDKNRIIKFVWNLVLSGQNLEVVGLATNLEKEKERKKKAKKERKTDFRDKP